MGRSRRVSGEEDIWSWCGTGTEYGGKMKLHDGNYQKGKEFGQGEIDG